MTNKAVIYEIDRIIKETWIREIKKDYAMGWLRLEYGLQSCMFFHLRKKLAKVLKENSLRIYTEYYFPKTKQRADMVIAEVDPADSYNVKDIIALFEFKYTYATDDETTQWVMKDIRKFKIYLQKENLENTIFYFGVIYEADCGDIDGIRWITDKRVTQNWASGRLTELDAGKINGKMAFGVNSFNGLNQE